MSKPALFTRIKHVLYRHFEEDIVTHVCRTVDFFQGEPVYMQRNGYLELEKVKSTVNIVPVTYLTVDEFKEMDSLNKCPIAILNDGLVILENQTINQDWSTHIQELTNHLDIQPVIDDLNSKFKRYFESPFYNIYNNDLTITNNGFKVQLNRNIDFELYAALMNTDYHHIIRGDIAYIKPRCINFEDAVAYVTQQLKPTETYGVGMYEEDCKWLNLMDVTYIPENADAILNHLKNEDNSKKHFKFIPNITGISGWLKHLREHYGIIR